jgi:hypothetical protein
MTVVVLPLLTDVSEQTFAFVRSVEEKIEPIYSSESFRTTYQTV